MGSSRERQKTYLVFPGVGKKTVELKKGLRSNAVKARIENQNVSSKCRMCGSHDETVQHILCSCPKLSQTEYKKRYDVVGRIIHWEVCKEYGVECSNKWYEHSPKSVEENEEVKLLWDFTARHCNSEREGKGNNHCGHSCSQRSQHTAESTAERN